MRPLALACLATAHSCTAIEHLTELGTAAKSFGVGGDGRRSLAADGASTALTSNDDYNKFSIDDQYLIDDGAIVTDECIDFLDDVGVNGGGGVSGGSWCGACSLIHTLRTPRVTMTKLSLQPSALPPPHPTPPPSPPPPGLPPVRGRGVQRPDPLFQLQLGVLPHVRMGRHV